MLPRNERSFRRVSKLAHSVEYFNVERFLSKRDPHDTQKLVFKIR